MNLLYTALVRIKNHQTAVLVSLIWVLAVIAPLEIVLSDERDVSALIDNPFSDPDSGNKIHVARIERKTGTNQIIRAHKPEYDNGNNTTETSASLSTVQSLPVSTKSGDMEYQLHYVTKSDTRESLALNYLGDSGEWLLIALHNELNPGINPSPGTVLRIPVRQKRSVDISRKSIELAAVQPTVANFFPKNNTKETLTLTSFSEANRRETTENSQADLFATRVESNKPKEQPDIWSGEPTISNRESTFGEPAVVSHKIDMFAGEARVFGKVDVSRVAVGNGSILRAEVLANGDLLAIAQAAGSSSLHLWHKDESRSDLNIRVSAEDPEYRVKLEKSIRMRVKMIEFRRSALKRLGIDWGNNIEGPVFATAGDFASNSLFRPNGGVLGDNLPLGVEPFSSYFGLATQLTSQINFLVTNGDAEMLAEPVLSCINGGTAKFLAGGEVPYPTVGANGQTNIEFREYGIRLEVSPVADENGNIQAAILTEVSSIDPSVTVMGAPGLLTRRTQTQVSVTGGDTIVIAGLLQSESGKDIDALPGIGRLPILGKLFRSDNLRNNVSELVIFITPEIVDPSRNSLSRTDQNTHEYSASRLQQDTEKLRKAWIK